MEIKLTKQSEIPFAGILGVVLRNCPPFVHCGLIYEKGSGEIAMSHLAWHHRFYGDALPENEYLWLDGAFDPELSESVAEYLEIVAEENRENPIPYSVTYPIDPFDPVTGKYIAKADGEGLTCATFVLAIFERLALPLIRRDTWPAGRIEDQKWARLIIATMEAQKDLFTREHLEAQHRALPEVVRYRPEEVASAFAQYPFLTEYLDAPLSFTETEPLSTAIKAKVVD